MTGNAPLREISERLYYLTSRIWLKSVPHLNLSDEIAVFRREMADILRPWKWATWRRWAISAAATSP